jgi:hypothetical protein
VILNGLEVGSVRDISSTVFLTIPYNASDSDQLIYNIHAIIVLNPRDNSMCILSRFSGIVMFQSRAGVKNLKSLRSGEGKITLAM